MILAIFNSCEEKGGFGIATDDVAPVEFVSTDVPIESSLVLLDSVITSAGSRVLVGELNGSAFGNNQSTGYFGINARVTFQPTFKEESAFDSVKIEFRASYLSDTASDNREFELEFHNINDDFPDTTYLSSNSLEIGDRLLAEVKVNITDFDSTYTFLADETWGQELFDGLKNDDERFTEQGFFNIYFPGIAVTKINQTNNVLGIVPGSTFKIVLYYNEPSVDGSGIVNKTFSFDNSSRAFFFGVQSDRSGTQFAQIDQTNTEYSGTSVLATQSGVGIVTKLKLDELSTFSSNVEGAIINSAVLEVGPIDEELVDPVKIPTSLLVLLTDSRNSLINDRGSFRSIQQDGSNQLQSGFPVQLVYNSETKMFTGSITSFVQAYYTDRFRRNEYFLYPSDMRNSLNGFVLPRENLNLKIFYSELR